MLKPQDVVAAGVSGGADSVCLLFLLQKMQERIPFRLLVVHVNHGIRREAGEDEAYVRMLCEKWQLPFFAVHADVAALAREQGISEEEAGRNLRYESFEKILKQAAPEQWSAGKAKIAVAHNQNDRAETMLFHLFRGTGLAGLCSIPPVRGCIIRPLLCLERSEIEAILADEGISYCIDCTNAEDLYTRNKIRNHLFPYITEEISPAAVRNMNRTAQFLEEARDYLQDESEKALERVLWRKEQQDEKGKAAKKEIHLNIEALLKEPAFLQSQVLLLALEKLAEGRKDITAAHIRAIQELCATSGSKSLNLPYGILVRKEYRRLTIEPAVKEAGPEGKAADPDSEAGLQRKLQSNIWGNAQEESREIPVIEIPGSYSLGEAGTLDFSTFSYEKDALIPQNQCTKWFDYDKIEKSIVIRKRKPGDYLTIDLDGALAHKSLKDYMIQEKIPKFQRDDLWILAEEDHVLWVIGRRISSKYKIDENTKRILQVQLRGGTTWQNM